jgi:hypothetical protein
MYKSFQVEPFQLFLDRTVWFLHQKSLKHPAKTTFKEVTCMGRAVVTKGHSRRKLGRTIRTLEASVEFSTKECIAKKEELKFKEKMQQARSNDDSPVQDLRNIAASKKDATAS